MINYTEKITLLMQDVVARVPTLSFIDIADVLVFARAGRSNAEGAFATCHCLSLPSSEPGYYFWRDRSTGRVTRRSEWFVTKSPVVSIGTREIKYLVSFALPRYCDQSLDRTRKERLYPGSPLWIAKLDTVVHELYHIDPEQNGIRRIERGDGTYSAHCHGDRFFETVAELVRHYLSSKPNPSTYEFLEYDFDELTRRYGGVVATTFRTFPSFPQRYIERLAEQPPCDDDGPTVDIEAVRPPQQPTRFTEDDLHIREFTKETSRRLVRKGAFRAA